MKIRKNQALPYTADASRGLLTNCDARMCSCMSSVVRYKPLTITQEVA